MEDFSGNVEDTFNATLDPVDEFQTNMNKLKILGTDIANSMMPTITKVMEKFGNTIQKVSDAWNGLSEGQQEAIIKIAGIVALVGPVLVGIGKFITLIGSVISSIGTITTLISGLVPVIGGIGGVITATVIPAIGGVITALAPFLPIILAVAGAIAGIIVVIKNWGAITDWIQEKWQIMTEFLSTGIDGLQAYLTEHFGIIGQVISTYIEYFKTVITTAVEVIRTVIQTVVEVVKALISGNFDQVGVIVQNGLNKVKTTISTAINYELSIVKTVLNNIKTAISTGITSVVNKIKTMGTTIKSTFLDLKDSALTWGKDLIQNFIDGIKAKIEALKDTVRGVAQTVRDFLGFSEPKSGPLSNFHTYGPDMMQNYAEGIKNAKYLVEQAVSDVAMDVNALLSDPIDYDKVYDAIRQGASDSTTRIILNNREVTRALSGMGVVFNG
jgi:phage-related protein